jgi:hypothetical protein
MPSAVIILDSLAKINAIAHTIIAITKGISPTGGGEYTLQ